MFDLSRENPHLRSFAALTTSALALAGGLFIAFEHPLSPTGAIAFLLFWAALSFWKNPLWIFALPAALPIMDLNAWSGWISFAEFDIAVLGIATGAYLRVLLAPATRRTPVYPSGNGFRYFFVAFAAWQIVSMAHGFVAGGGTEIDGFGDYTSASNAWRIGKSSLFALLLAPLLFTAKIRYPRHLLNLFERGMQCGLLLVCVAAIWERVTYPGLLDFSETYRTSALFWEMHVGGAAIDCYLVIALPFAIKAVAGSRTRITWLAAAALVSGAIYVLLTTFSRGVYLASFVSIALLLWRFGMAKQLFSPRKPWHRKANILLASILAIECAVVVVGGSVMLERVNTGGRDLIGRVLHWSEGLRLLETPTEWLIGRGSGRFPEDYSNRYPSHPLPATFTTRHDIEHGLHGVIHGPQRSWLLAGLFGVGQNLGRIDDELLGVELDVRGSGSVAFMVRVCEKHLIEEGNCLWERHQLEAKQPGWQHVSLNLYDEGFGHFIRPAWLIISVLKPGGELDIDNITLHGQHGPINLRNPGFDHGQTGWILNGGRYFLPWHIDSLYLELLIDSGLIGLTLFLVMIYDLCRKAISNPFGYNSHSAYGLAAVVGLLTSGVFVSVIDMPRVAFLFLLTCIMFRLQDRTP